MEDAVRFEARCRYDTATLRQVSSLMQGGRRRGMILAGSIVLGASLLIGVINPSERPSWWLMALLCITLLFSIFQPSISAWLAGRQRRKIMNGVCGEITLRFTDKEIEGKEVRNVQYYQYEQIVGIRQSRSMWLMMIDRMIALPVLKANFTQGQAEDFPDFIRSKCPGIKGF